MAGTVIDEIFISLGLDGSKASAGMKKASADIKGGLAGIRTSMQSVMGLFTGFTAGLAGVFAISSQFSDWKTKSIEIQNAARQANHSMEEMQAWNGALAQFGGNMDTFTASFRTLNGELVKYAATGRSRTATILESFGIDAGSQGRLRAFDDVLGDIAEVMKNMSVDEAIGLGSKVGIDAPMVMLLRQGRDAYKDIIEQKKKDAIYTEEDAKTVREYNASMKQLGIGVARIANVFFRLIVPVFTQITRVVGDFVKYLSKHETAVKAFFVMLSGLILYLLLPSIVAFFTTLLANPITWVILLLAGLAAMIEDLVVWSQGGNAALGDLWTMIFGDPKKAEEMFNTISELATEAWNTIKQVWTDFINNEQLVEIALYTLAGVIMTVVIVALSELAVALLTNPIFWIVAVIMAIVAAFVYWDEIVAWVSENIGSQMTALANWIDEQFDAVEQWVADCLQGMSDKANEVIENIKGFFSGLKDAIMSAIGEAVDWALGKLASLAQGIANLPVIGGAIDYVMGGSGGSNTTNNTTTSVGEVNVYTQSTSPQETGAAVGRAMAGWSPAYADGGSK